MKTIAWWVLAALGGVCMFAAYRADRPAEPSAFSSGLIYVPKATTARTLDRPDRKLARAATRGRVRLLPLSGMAASVAQSAAMGDPKRAKSLELQMADRVFEAPFSDLGLTEKDLQSGRLPKRGANELVAGPGVSYPDVVQVHDRKFSVVGHLRPDAVLLSRSYLLERSKPSSAFFSRPALLLTLSPAQLQDSEISDLLAKQYPPEQFEVVKPVAPMGRGPFYGYLFGEALLCLGGTGGFIGLYAAAARGVSWRFLSDPLLELSNRRRLLWAVHLVFFGLCLGTALLVYQAPEIQQTLIGVMRGSIQSGTGPLGLAGKAYASRSIPIAAFVTFGVNFFLGSLVEITLPSLIIPGSGALLAAFRFALWGLVLSPSTTMIARMMVPHSGTLLLEGEAYIVATFFALLVPIYLSSSNPLAAGLGRRYRDAFVINLKGNLLVALLLVVAAAYEATEVITMMKMIPGTK